ncbi:MAG: phytanoyl-CoA dioxygenase family protein [Actinomycetota bacterium]|nr:phytanoyl-CoA dioxygenase family protein [Actinomycetota bacterium]
MTAEQVLAARGSVLTREQREFYVEHGYLVLPRFVDAAWLERLRAITTEFLERGRREADSGLYVFGPGHTPERPRLKCLKLPDDRHPDFWAFATGPIADVACDLVGPNVKFSHSILDFKWGARTDEWKWHQDIQYFPHTNYSPVTIGVYLEDTTVDDGALGVVPGSHDGPLYDLYDADGNWAGHLRDEDAATIPLDEVTYLEGPAGTVTAHNCRTLHWSPPSAGRHARPFLANIFSSCDAFAYQLHPDVSSHRGVVVRGVASKWARHDPRPCLVPPR